DGFRESSFKKAALGERPSGERRRLGSRFIAEADGGVAVLEFGDDFGGHRATAGDLGEVVSHLAESVGGAVGEKEDSGFGDHCGLDQVGVLNFFHILARKISGMLTL